MEILSFAYKDTSYERELIYDKYIFLAFYYLMIL